MSFVYYRIDGCAIVSVEEASHDRMLRSRRARNPGVVDVLLDLVEEYIATQVPPLSLTFGLIPMVIYCTVIRG